MEGFRKHITDLEEITLNLSKYSVFNQGNKINMTLNRNNLDPEALGLLKEGLLIYQSELKILRLNLSRFEFFFVLLRKIF